MFERCCVILGLCAIVAFAGPAEPAGGTDDPSIIFGSPAAFKNAATSFNSAAALDETHVLVAYVQNSRLTTVVGTVAGGNVISYGAGYEHRPGGTMGFDDVRAVALDAGHALVVYTVMELSGFDTTYAVVATVESGNVVTYGTPVAVTSPTVGNFGYDIAVAALDASHAIIAYRSRVNQTGRCIVATITQGNKVNFNYDLEQTFNSGTVTRISATALDAKRAFIAYRDEQVGSQGAGVVATITGGNVISVGPKAAFNTAATYRISVTALDTSHALVAYENSGGTGQGTGIVATITGGNVIGYGTAVEFAARADRVSATTLTTSRAIIAYRDAASGNRGTAVAVTVTGGNVLTYGPAVPYSSGNTVPFSAATLTRNSVFIAYTDAANSSYGTGIVGTQDPTGIEGPEPTPLAGRGLALSPNPVTGGFATLRFTGDQVTRWPRGQVRVFDAAGRSVLRQSTIGGRQSTMSLDLRKVPAGVYLVRLDAGDTTVTQKLVVQK